MEYIHRQHRPTERIDLVHQSFDHEKEKNLTTVTDPSVSALRNSLTAGGSKKPGTKIPSLDKVNTNLMHRIEGSRAVCLRSWFVQ